MVDEQPEEVVDASAETSNSETVDAAAATPEPEYKIGSVVGISRGQQSIFVAESLPVRAKSAYAVPDATGQRAFVTRSVLEASEIDLSTLREGDMVQFAVGEDGFLVQDIKKVETDERSG